MPVERLSTPRELRGERIRTLSDFQFRVWSTYKVAADDFGVMPMAASSLKAFNPAFEERPDRALVAVLRAFVDSLLLLPFEDQRREFVCSPEWQTHQRIRFPRESHYPIPPDDLRQRFDEATRKLFRERLEKASASSKDLGDITEPPRERYGETSDLSRNLSVINSESPARGGARNANAYANDRKNFEKGSGEKPDIGPLINNWVTFHKSCTGRGVPSVSATTQYQPAEKLLSAYPLERVWEMARALLTTTHWDGKPRNIAMLCSLAPELDRWLDEHPGVPFRSPISSAQTKAANTAAAGVEWMSICDAKVGA